MLFRSDGLARKWPRTAAICHHMNASGMLVCILDDFLCITIGFFCFPGNLFAETFDLLLLAADQFSSLFLHFTSELMEVRGERDIALIAQNILNVIQVPCDVGVHCLTISASIGISIFPKDGTTADRLVKRADKAMYHAKQTKCGYAFAQ